MDIYLETKVNRISWALTGLFLVVSLITVAILWRYNTDIAFGIFLLSTFIQTIAWASIIPDKKKETKE